MNALMEYIRQRSVSTLLISYSVFWAICHWEGIYTTFFTSQDFIMEKYGILKNEYVRKYFFGISQDNFACWLIGIIVPAMLALFYVWVLPRILINPSYEREIKFKVDREEMRIKEEKRLAIEGRKKVEEQSKEAEAKIELNKKKAEIEEIDPRTGWSNDYEELMSSNATDFMSVLEDLKNTVYSNDGYFSNSFSSQRYMPEDSLMLCDVNELISFDDTDRSRIYLTDKGRYFLKKFVRDK